MPRINTLQEYRHLQRQIRREFDRFTIIHCKTCPQPCCVWPCRMTPDDVMLAEGIGWTPPEKAILLLDSVQTAATDYLTAATNPQVLDDGAPRPACPYLLSTGCSFPVDMHPYGCTEWICPIMYEHMDRQTLQRLKRLVRDLTRVHEALITGIHREK